MDRSQILEDKIKSICFSYAINMQPIKKFGMVKKQKGWISVVDSYLTLSHKIFIRKMKPHNSDRECDVCKWSIEGDKGVNYLEDIQGDLEEGQNCRINL